MIACTTCAQLFSIAVKVHVSIVICFFPTYLLPLSKTRGSGVSAVPIAKTNNRHLKVSITHS
jgi:hypothetical protein